MMAEDHTDLRASDLERERTIDALRAAAGEGRVTFEELADRIQAAGDASTHGELDRLTRDLPAPDPAPDRAATAGGDLAAPARRSSVFGDVRCAGSWLVPEQSSWQSIFGDIVLDLREARVGTAEVAIAANTVFGDVQLLVPEGVFVEVRMSTLFGDIRQQAGNAAPGAAPRVILSGRTVFGDVRIRPHRLRERVADRILGRDARG